MAYRYKTIKVNGKTKLLHRHVMEQFLGRQLLPSEQVHHKNGNCWDNRIENLSLLSCKEHMHGHKQKYPLTKRCIICGKEFTPHPTKRKRAQTCSETCAYTLRSRSMKRFLAEALVRANCADMAVETVGVGA